MGGHLSKRTTYAASEMTPRTHYSSVLSLCFVLIVHCSTRNGLAAGACVGIQTYKLTITMNWTKENDQLLPKNPTVPAVFAVAHTADFKLFEEGKKLDNKTVDFVRNKKPAALKEKLEAEMKKRKKTVVQFVQTTADQEGKIALNVEVDGGLNATRVSLIGLLFPSPDFFFGASGIEMCNGTQFREKIPADSKKLLWADSFDAGIDDRNETQKEPKIVSRPVSIDNRKALRQGYATYSLEQGRFRYVPQKWRIYVIAGCVVVAAVIAVISVAVLNHQKKKKFRAANPPPAA